MGNAAVLCGTAAMHSSATDHVGREYECLAFIQCTLICTFPQLSNQGYHCWCNLFVFRDLSTLFAMYCTTTTPGTPWYPHTWWMTAQHNTPTIGTYWSPPHSTSLQVDEISIPNTTQILPTTHTNPLQSSQPHEQDAHNGKIAFLIRSYDLLLHTLPPPHRKYWYAALVNLTPLQSQYWPYMHQLDTQHYKQHHMDPSGTTTADKNLLWPP